MSFEKMIENLDGPKLQAAVEFAQKETKRVRTKLYGIQLEEKIPVYYMITKAVSVDRTEELHIPTVDLELTVKEIGSLQEAEELVAKMISSNEARLRPIQGDIHELPSAGVWKQIAEKLLVRTLPKNFFEPIQEQHPVKVLESEDV